MNKPVQSVLAARYEEVVREYQDTVSAVNTSYGSVAYYSSSSFRSTEQKLDALDGNAEFLAKMAELVAKASVYETMLRELIRIGADVEAAEYQDALYRFYEFERAQKANVTLEEIAFAKAKHDAIAASKTAKKRREFDPFWSLMSSYEVANGQGRTEVLEQVEALVAAKQIRYFVTKNIFTSNEAAA